MTVGAKETLVVLLAPTCDTVRDQGDHDERGIQDGDR
jgi:hypothetical protein